MDPSRYGYTPQSRPADRYRQAPSPSEGQIRIGIDYRDAGRVRVPVGMEKQQDAQRTYGRPSNLPKPKAAAQPAPQTYIATSGSRMGCGYRKPSAQPALPTDHQRQQAQTSQMRLKRMPAFNQPERLESPRIVPASKRVEQWPLPVDEEEEVFIQPPAGHTIPELDRYRPHYPDPFSDAWYGIGIRDVPPVHSSQSSYSQYSSGYSAHSASPSTRFSESPRPGAYSRDTTPTSSPGLLPPFQAKPLLPQESPKFSRPPVTKRRMGSASEDATALSTVRESLTSSSSNSTVKDSAKESGDKEKNKKKKKRLSPMPPSPPPRKSSVKFKSNPLLAETSPVKAASRGLGAATMTSGSSPRMSTDETSPQKSMALPQQSVTSPPFSPNVPSRIGLPPRRPSRDGTLDLSGLAEPASIVHSNLMNAPSSVDTRTTTSRLPARKGAAPLPPLGIPRKATPAPAAAGLGFQLPDPRSATTPTSGLRTPSPSTASSATASKHRFGLFGRRDKTAAADAPPAEKKKILRKGPAAGTGHEGYGRYAFGGRGRSNTHSSRDRSLSNVSTTSQESYGSSMTAMSDPFFSQRSSPVVIAGGGKIVENYNNSSNDLSRTESNQSQQTDIRPSLESKISHSSSRSNLSNMLFPPPTPNNAAASTTSLASKASDSSDTHRWSPKKNLAARRSLLRLNKKDVLGLQPPKAINVPGSRESGISTQGSMYDGPGLEPVSSISGPNKLTKRATSPRRKWHFFQRKPRVEKPQPVEPISDAAKNPLTYFAIDSDEDKSKITVDDLKDIMREAEVPEFHDIEVGYEKPEELQRPPMRPRAGSKGSFTLFPKIDEPKMEPEPQSAIEQGIPMMWNNADRVSPKMRLPQVGRIPKVVATHPPPTQATVISSPEMSERSFSRPFRLSVAREPAQPPTPNDPSSVALGPSPEKSPALPQEEKPYFAFSPRKNSEAGTTSGSSGIVSNYEGTTAVVPKPEESWNDDEVWDEEFDDLIRTPSVESPLAQVNLRVGSMTVSKWLTFGHVLFSPARESLNDPQPSKHHSILVIDGLGNDDWSFYAAETYPDATFYNLTTSSQQPNSTRMSMSTTAIPARPPNHRQVQHLSLGNKFPFIPNTFTIVVIRFLTASSESLMRHVVAESKRVLKPGGFLEMSVLDLDMRDMGPKTRRAVRDLKINVSLHDPEISLASTADTMMRLVNKRGFTNIKSCNVGVPVATIVPNNSAAGTPMGGESDSKEHKELRKEVSLADLMRDPDPKGDAGITKMVAKVGRWWFKQCYEKRREKSIFDDEKVLAECEKWETSFKLCVAHAQKGEARRRRTASV